jgi:hypothetical protein
MNSQELRALQEAYTQVYQELDEALDPKFGSMRKRGGRSAPPEERTVGGEMNRRNKDYWADTQGANRDRGAGNKAKRRAAELNKEEVETDLFDHILEHLVAEGYADTNEAAIAIMANMSEEWRQDIVEGMTMKDFKQQRSRQKQKEKRAAEKTSPLRRAGIHADKASPERAARHRANVDPDFEGNDERNYPGGKLRPNKVRKAKALGELGEQVDLFDYILEHLVAEGYADTNKAALAIMANMSEEWKQDIVEGGFNSSGRYDVGGGRTVGPVAGAVRSLFSGNLPKGQTYVPPTKQTGPNRPPAVPASKDDSGKLTDFGAGGGKKKMQSSGMSVGQVERQGRMNKGDYSG